MKILTIHADFIEFEAKKKALKEAEPVEEGKQRVEECLVIFTAVEKRDEVDIKAVTDKYIEQIEDIVKQVKTKTIVLYPYAHLSSSLSNPKKAEQLMKEAEKKFPKEYKVVRAPFGWYKSFTIACKGHPLSELSREFTTSGQEGGECKVSEVKALSAEEIKSLLKQVSRAKLDTSRLKENDHRIIGQNLDWWSFNEVAPGMVFWHDKGLKIKNGLINYWREKHWEAGYQEISTPQIMDAKLWKISGHWDKYKENNLVTEYEKRPFLVKPMNCPGGMLVYKASPKSYKDFPLRVGEMGVVHRCELSGVLAGLFRVIQFTQDDAHIFCLDEKQVKEEIEEVMNLINLFYKDFKLNFDHVELSTRPEKRIGTEKQWAIAEKILEDVLKKNKVKYKINKGEGAFYGPKIDFHVKDSLDRTWQVSTIQLDFALPERFDLEYSDKDGKMKRPAMLHRVIYGSLERFIGIMTEHLNGKLPLWLSPVQVKVLTITDEQIHYAKKIVSQMEDAGLRVEFDSRAESMGKKVREAIIEKVNYVITIGEKEVQKKTIAVRDRSGETKFDVKLETFIADLKNEIEKREIK